MVLEIHFRNLFACAFAWADALLGSLTFVNLDRRQVLNFDPNYKYLFKTKPQRTMYNSFHLKGVFGYLGEEKEWVGMIGIKSIYDL
jgi:hypothetical protein